jgi:hypothetical protein
MYVHNLTYDLFTRYSISILTHFESIHYCQPSLLLILTEKYTVLNKEQQFVYMYIEHSAQQ